ncbi:MAG TPA: tetratricopeptide repeat protein, partial [Candidatus Binatia bacterium]|nr:tetratricopeptide repeat protein [Candidatus Binatia bacterium]
GFDRRPFFSALSIASLLTCAACEPPRPYRIPVPPTSNPVLRTPPPSPVPSPPPPDESARKPLPQEPNIREQDLKDKPQTERVLSKETKEPAPLPSTGEISAAPEAPPAPLPDDSSLLAKITPGVTPQRAASLRLTEEGKKLLDSGDPTKALARLEKTIVIDSTNAYGYFYLAKAQYRLGRYRESLNFLDIAESRLGNEPFWLAEIHALRGENYRTLGQLQSAEASYQQAVRLNSGNRTAADGLLRLQSDKSFSGK